MEGVCEEAALGEKKIPIGARASKFRLLWLLAVLAGVSLLGTPIRSQEQHPDWQAEVKKRAEAQDWDSAMRIVDREVARAPQDMDVRAWRARVLAWSGRLAEAEKEYLEI